MDSPGRWHVPFTVLLAVLLDPCHSATFMGSSFHWDPSLTYSLQHPPSLTPVDIWGDYDDSLTNAIEDTSFEGYQKHSFHMKDAKGGVYVMIPDEAANLTDPSYRSKLEEVTRGAGHDESGILEKRSISQFGRLITINSNINPFRLMFYGNWCGRGGGGATVDGIDRCCMIHDKCYSRVERAYCDGGWRNHPYVTRYQWRAEFGRARCMRSGDPCQDETCLCDVRAANCFGSNAFNRRHQGRRIRTRSVRG